MTAVTWITWADRLADIQDVGRPWPLAQGQTLRTAVLATAVTVFRFRVYRHCGIVVVATEGQRVEEVNR